MADVAASRISLKGKACNRAIDSRTEKEAELAWILK